MTTQETSVIAALKDISNHLDKMNAKYEKQETLEEAAEYHVKMQYPMGVEKEYVINDFIAGAKWQAERMYSEAEVLQLLLRLKQTESYDNLYDWFKKFIKNIWNKL